MSRALHGAYGDRRRLLGLLEDAIGLLDADRAAVLWVDEYGPGMVHAHVVLDLISERPRRSFALEPLRLAWQEGVPGILDAPDMERSEIPVLHDTARSACAVALGSDGARAWFLVADGSTPRAPLSADATQALMFFAGETAAVVLHRDIDATPATSATGEAAPQRFAGWAVLQDMEGREADTEAGRRISARFLVARALLAMVDDDFASDPEGLVHQIESTRSELADVLAGDSERAAWDAVLEALERRDLSGVAQAALVVAEAAEAAGHNHGASTFYRAAYDVAAAGGESGTAVEAGRLLARLERRQGVWRSALGWYEVSRDIARERGDRAKEAVVLTGWGNVLRDKGNLPAARAIFEEGLEAARESGEPYALGSAHHALMAVEMDSGSVGRAIIHGWRAVEVYPEEENRLQAMTSLASCFVRTGELDAADDAYSIVLARMDVAEYRFAAAEELAYISALRGQAGEFEARARDSDATGWATLAGAWTRAEVLLCRGLGHEALGHRDEALSWLRRAQAYAESNGVNKVAFDADTALTRIAEGTATRPELAEEARAPEDEMPEIRRGLSAMREALACV